MKTIAQERLNELRREYDNGTQQLKNLETRCEELRQTLLRISGAVQVLEELQQESARLESQTEANPLTGEPIHAS